MVRPNAPTLQDVANHAGVSTATISRALNEPDKVAKPTREKIESSIEHLGYTPNFGGKALASNRTNTVGAIIPSLSNAMFANGVQALQEVLSEAGVLLLIATTDDDPEQEARQVRALVSHGASALMLVGNDRPKETEEFLRKRGIPWVNAWTHQDDPKRLFAGFDNFQAAYDATKRALELGHRKIAMISGRTATNDRARDRANGVVAAIADHGAGATLTNSVEARYRLGFGSDAFARIMDTRERPTAIMCGNDVLAAGALVRAREMGISVPQEVSIVGFDDIGLATVSNPQLATVRVPQIDMGRHAAKMLLAQIEGKTEVPSRKFETQFIMRESLGACPV